MRSLKILHVYVAAIALGGAVILVAISDQPILFPQEPAFWLLTVGVICGEFIRIKVPHRKETITVTVGDPFTLSLLFMFGLAPAILVKIIATLLDDVHRRQVWWKAVFNAAQFALALAVGDWVLHAFGETHFNDPSLTAHTILAALGVAIAYFIFNMAIVTTAISLAIGESILDSVKSNLKTRVIQQGTLLGFTPVVIAALGHSVALFPLLLIPIVVVYYSGSLMQRHVILAEQLRDLYETTRMSRRGVQTRDSVHELLERVIKMFSAEIAAITLFPSEGIESALMTRLDLERNDFSYMAPVELDPKTGVWARVAAEDKALLIAAPISNQRLKDHFETLGMKDVMVAPMRSDNSVIGIIEVANRQGRAETFSNEDLKLFETLANHASIALENARLIDELEGSLAHLTEMNQLKDDFVASVSHELRTPLTSIRGYVKTLLRPDAHFAPEETEAFLETIDRQSQRLHRLIEDLLVVSRIESSSPEEELVQEVSLAELTTEVIDELRGKLDDRKVTMSLDDHIPVIETDPGKLHQILCNLVDNAVKYSPAGAPLDIEAHTQGAGITLTVRDSGPGIDEDAQEKIFERFYQVDQTATRRVGGAGLGLYICRKLAEALGGRLWLESSGPEGSEFSLWIPTATATRPSLDLAEELKRLTNLP